MTLAEVFKQLFLVLLITASMSVVSAERVSLAVVADDTVATVLTQQMGKSVTVKLDSGNDMSGIIKFVGRNLLYLSTLKGLEYYDAVVQLGNIEAVIVRVKK